MSCLRSAPWRPSCLHCASSKWQRPVKDSYARQTVRRCCGVSWFVAGSVDTGWWGPGTAFSYLLAPSRETRGSVVDSQQGFLIRASRDNKKHGFSAVAQTVGLSPVPEIPDTRHLISRYTRRWRRPRLNSGARVPNIQIRCSHVDVPVQSIGTSRQTGR